MHHQTAPREEQIVVPCRPMPAMVTSQSASRAFFTSPMRPNDEVGSRFARSVINARAARRKFFDPDLFADPAWDMLLELYALECEGRRISVSKLSVAAGVPCTTTLRWIDKLESESLIFRAADEFDARRIWIGLSDLGLEKMRAYTEQVSATGIPI